MNISIRQLQAFVAVAKYQSFTKAAEKIHVTQAGLSAMIRELETHLGGRLFSRTKRSVDLNEMGKSFLPFASRTVEDMNATVAELGLLQSQTRRQLRIGITPFIASTIIPAVLDAFGKSDPGIAVSVFDTNVEEIQRSVESGEFDAGFGSFFAEVSGVSRKVIACTRLVLVSPAGDRQNANRDRRSTTWAALGASPLITLPEDNPIQIAVDSQLKALRMVPVSRTRANHLETVIALVEAGRGIAILPSFVFAACARHRVQAKPLRDPEVLINYYRITRAGRGEIEVVNRFVDCFVSTAMQGAFFLPAGQRASTRGASKREDAAKRKTARS